MKIAIMTHDAYSHINGIKYLVKELSKYNEVYVFVSKDNMNILPESNNIKKIIYTDTIEKNIKHYKKNNPINTIALGITRKLDSICDYVDDALNPLVEILNYSKVFEQFYEQELMNILPDLILRDTCNFAAKMVGEKLNIPIYGYNTSSTVNNDYIKNNTKKALADIFNWDLELFSDTDIKELKELINERIWNICNLEKLNKIPIAYLLDPAEEKNFCFSIPFYELEGDYISVKPNIYYEREYTSQELKKRSEIYVSSGSKMPFPGSMYNYTINALKGYEYESVISFIYMKSEFLKISKLPINVRMEEFSNQLERLTNAKLFITHGGYNSIQESIFYNVPMIVIPLCSDMFFNARCIEESGLGIKLNKRKLSTEIIKNSIDNIISNNDIKKNLFNMNKAILDMDDMSAVVKKHF